VAAFTPDDVEQIYDIRQALECLALRSAIRRISLTDLVTLEKRLEALENEEPGWNQEQAQTDVELHGLIIRNSNNPRLMTYLENISLLIHSLRLIGYRNDHHARQAGREHLAIVRALKERDLEAAERILADHIDASKKNALEIFSNRHQALQQYSVRPTGSGFSPVLFNNADSNR
jgi:DNA-binding GntR family transcriptional regulator